MKPRDLIALALGRLTTSRLRTALTMLGVIIMRDGRILSDERQTPRNAVVPPATPDDEEDPP